MASPNGMIRFWQLPELVEKCLSNLKRDDSDDRKTLARCARVSKPVSEIALERLWNKMRGLKPLFQLLSDSVTIHVWEDDHNFFGAATENPTTYVS